MKALFLLALSFTLHCVGFSKPESIYSNNDSVKIIADQIANHNIYESATIGFAATASTQYKRFNKLLQIATNEELFLLVQHENGVVRLYALRAIIIKKLKIPFAIREHFLNDKTKVTTLTGCIGNNSTVGLVSKAILSGKPDA